MAITSSAVAAETLEDVEPGSKSVDLGDGYEISFELADCIGMYDLEVIDPSESVLGSKYELVIHEAEDPGILMDIWINVWPW